MKLVVIALFALVVAIAADDKYTTKYDGIDIEEILRSERLFTNYYNCLLEKGKCTPDGRELKRLLPDALKTECSKCSEPQRVGTDRVIRFLINNKPEAWKELASRYDPDGLYQEKYRDEADKRGIKV